MESITSRHVNDLPASEKRTLEDLLGRELGPDQQVFIMAYTPDAVPEKAVREAARAGLQRLFERADRHAEAQGVAPDEAEAAIDEAMGHIRPRHR